MYKNDVVVDFNVIAAAAICGANIESTKFILPAKNETFENPQILHRFFNPREYVSGSSSSPYKSWQSFLEKNASFCAFEKLESDRNGSLRLPIHQFVLSLINQVVNSSVQGVERSQQYLLALSIFYVSLPFIARGFPTDAIGIISIIFETILMIVYFPINLLLLYCPLLDANRRLSLAQILTDMISVSHVGSTRVENTPTVNFFKAQNVYAWLYTRLVIQCYGRRMLYRLDLYLGSYIILSTLILVVYMVLVFSDEGDYGDETNSELFHPVLVQVCQ